MTYLVLRYYSLYSEMFAEMERIDRAIDKAVLKSNMLSIIQNHKYCPSVHSGQINVKAFRKTPFSNKRIHCKRKRRIQYV